MELAGCTRFHEPFLINQEMLLPKQHQLLDIIFIFLLQM
jgi:hypothetical protein